MKTKKDHQNLTKDITAEGSCLGSVLIDPGKLPDVQAILPDELFFSRREHQILYKDLMSSAMIQVYSVALL